MYKALTIYCFQNFLLSRDYTVRLEKTNRWQGHLSDHRRVKTWFEIQTGRERLPGILYLEGRIPTKKDRRVFLVKWGSTRVEYCVRIVSGPLPRHLHPSHRCRTARVIQHKKHAGPQQLSSINFCEKDYVLLLCYSKRASSSF